MSIRVTQEFVNRGSLILNNAWDEVRTSTEPFHCPIEDCVLAVLAYDKAKTYKYILLTQLLGKAVDERVNILAMKASSRLDGAWDARNLCEGAIVRSGFEKNVLLGVLGLSKQPYNSSPGQKPELSKDNATRSCDIPLRDLLIDSLQMIRTSDEAYACIRFYLAECERQMMLMEDDGPALESVMGNRTCSQVSCFLSDVARRGRDGEGLALAAALALHVTLGERLGYEMRLGKINASKKGEGDLDVYYAGERFATMELKDKPFSPEEVRQYARRARKAGWPRFYFVFGPHAGDGPGEVFGASSTDTMREGGMLVSCLSFDSLKDALLLSVSDVDLGLLGDALRRFIEEAQIKPGTTTAAREAYRRLCGL